MTKIEIMNMVAGREMDALIAEKILGWKWIGFEGGYQRLCFKNGNDLRYGAICQGGETEYTNNLHNYSTDMGAAWEVAEKMFSLYWDLKLETGSKSPLSMATFYRTIDQMPFLGCAETAPLSICRAALLCVSSI